MRAVVQDTVGPPHRVLHVAHRPSPRPAPHEAVVALEASPIHPDDLRSIAGRHTVRPRLPGATPGREGIGRVIEIGADVDGLSVGQRVLLPLRVGAWCDRQALPGASLVPAPPGLDAAQLAMARIPPLAACRLLQADVNLRRGEWLIHNAANGAVGQRIIARARQLGLRTIHIVRRPQAEAMVRKAGGDIILVDRGRPLVDEVRSYTGGATLRLALDGIGGAATGRLVSCLSHGGTLLHYGAASDAPVQIDPTALIARDVRVRGFWLPSSLQGACAPSRKAAQDDALELVARSPPIPIAATYGLGSIESAVRHAARERRAGKVLLTGEAWEG